ncbi:MAG: methylaspartate mutase subunit E [Desulfocucumaceae bacterium]
MVDDKSQPRNVQLSLDEFFEIRKEVTGMWPTGREIDLEEATEYHRRLPDHKRMSQAIRRAKACGDTLIHPRGGFALIDDHIDLLRCLQNEGGADILPTTTDSYTRNERFKEAEKGIEESRKRGNSMLNGLPIVNYGARAVRRVIEAVDRPVYLLSGTPFPRLTAETAIAAGFTGYLGSGIAYTVSYSKELSIAKGIQNYQYVDRLVAYYADHGVEINREEPGFLSGTLVPPGVSIAVSVLDTLLAAGQGLKYYNVGASQNLAMIQDVATLRVLPEMCREYLEKLGFPEMFQAVVSYQWMSGFPPDEAQAFSIISLGGIIPVMGNATLLVTKTTHEALGIPTKEANAAGCRATKQAIKCMRGFRLPDCPELDLEMEMIRKEVRAIVDRVLEMGDGDAALGAVRGFKAGVIDVPWSPNLEVANRVMPARDINGAIRYYDHGDLPLPKDVLEYHREKLMERTRKQNREFDINLAIDDVYEMSRSVAGSC